jgi:alpha-tubulin suppressor-like RCC1 family protein
MNKMTKISIFTLASALFSGILLQASPIKVQAYDDFIVELHNKTILKAEVGDNFSVILTSDYQVYTFGKNDVGQLGNGTEINSNEPINITNRFNLAVGETIEDIDAGANHSVALTSLNRIFVWGGNSQNQLGTSGSVSLTPLDLTMFLNADVGGVRPSVTKIEASNVNTLVLRDTNVSVAVSLVGDNSALQLGRLGGSFVNIENYVNLDLFDSIGEKVIDAGIYHNTAYAISSTGRVATWGLDDSGQLGNGSSNTNSETPGLISFTGVNAPERVISVATGTSHSVAVTNFGSVFFWGSNAGYAIGEALPLNDSKKTPYNLTSYYSTMHDSYPIFGEDPYEEDLYWLPFAVEAGYRSTFFKVSRATKIAPSTTFTFEDWYEFNAVGTNTFGNVKGTLAWTESEFLLKPYYIDYNNYDDAEHASISFSRTNLFILNTEGDFTMYGSNIFGQQGLGFNSENVFNDDVYDESNYNHNFSNNVRDFENYVYNELPADLTAPINNYFDESDRMTEYEAIYGYWYNEGDRNEGIIDYYFGEIFTEKEWELISEAQLTKMRTIFAEIFEDQVLYGWVPATNEELLTYVKDDLEERYWLREDMEAMTNYQSWELSWDDLITLDAATIALLDANVEPRLDDFRALLANIMTFENDVLQPFVALLYTLNAEDIEYAYLDDNGELVLNLGNSDIERLIGLGYTDDILAIFDAYNELSELEQLLLMERHDINYNELFDEYYEYFADAYSDELEDFEFDVQEGEWDNYSSLFENLTALEALLEGRDALNPISYDMFADFYVDGDDNIYDYSYYEYWIWLNDLLPALQEGKDVFDLIVLVEAFIQYDEYSYVELENVPAILEMYEAFLLLSEEAQNLLDPEYVNWIYGLALEALVYEVDLMLFDLSNTEDEGYALVLFENYNDVLAAIAKYEALPEDALELLDLEAIEYYEYLLGLQPYLEEGFDVYEAIKAIDEMDLEAMDDATIEAISDMYNDYLNLSEEAKSLLDPEYVETLRDLAIQAVESYIAELPLTVETFDDLFNDEETKDAAVTSLLNAWNAYQAMSDELKDGMDEVQRAHLEAVYNRYLELSATQLDLSILALIIVHLSVGAYFAFKKRDVLIKIND